MSIPSTKASTQYVDSGTDLISNARADIKQNIENVNELIDHLDGSQKYAGITGTNTEELVSGSTYRKAVTVANDLDSLITNSTYTFNIPAGKYAVWLSHPMIGGGGNQVQGVNVDLYDETADSSLGTFNRTEIATTNTDLYEGFFSFELSVASDVSYRVTSSSASNRNDSNIGIIIHKFA